MSATRRRRHRRTRGPSRGGRPRPGRGPRARGRPDGGAGARGRHGALRRCEPAGAACWPGGTAPPRPSAASGPTLTLVWHAADGDELKPGDTVLEVAGPLRPILTAERTALNFLGHLSGIATLTARFVGRGPRAQPRRGRPRHPQDHARPARAREGGRARRRRDQPPGQPLRRRAGQGQPPGRHRASPRRCAGPATLWPGRMVEIECDALDQVAEAARAGADAVLLDNMDPATVRRGHRRWRTPRRARAHPHRGLRWRHARDHRRLRGGRAGPHLGRRADPLGPRARPRSRPGLDEDRRRRTAHDQGTD